MTPVERMHGLIDAMLSVLDDHAPDQPITAQDVQESMRRAEVFLAEHPEEQEPPAQQVYTADPNLIYSLDGSPPPSFAYPRGKPGR